MTIDDQVTARDEVRRVLNETQDALTEIEIKVDEVNSLMVELLMSNRLSQLAKLIADDLGSTANALFKGLDQRVEELRKEIAANNDDGEDEVD